MPHARQYTRTGSEALAGTHLDSDLDLLFAFDNAHDVSTTEHGATGANVGTTNTQTLTNKTLTSPVISGQINTLGLKYQTTAVTVNITTTTVVCGVTDVTADRTLTFLSADIAMPGRVWFIKDEAGTCGKTNKIILATEGAETIDGQSTIDLVEPFGCIKIYSNGTNLFTLNT